MDFYFLFQAYPSPQVVLKRLEYLEGSFYYPRKTRLSDFRNRTVRFQKSVYPVFMGITPWTELTLSPHISLLTLLFSSFNREGDPKTPIGDFLIPPWNLRALG
jgi:hypothetical protein